MQGVQGSARGVLQCFVTAWVMPGIALHGRLGFIGS